MTKTVTIGKRILPLEHIALVEPFDPAAHPGMKTDKAFKARVVLTDRQSVLTEEAVEAFEAHGFRPLAQEGIALNPAVRFSVESFEATPGFEPTKPFLTRLSWRNPHDGSMESKLLLSPPETVLAVAVTGEGEVGAGAPTMARMKAGSGAPRKPTASIDRRNARRRPPESVPL